MRPTHGEAETSAPATEMLEGRRLLGTEHGTDHAETEFLGGGVRFGSRTCGPCMASAGFRLRYVNAYRLSAALSHFDRTIRVPDPPARCFAEDTLAR
jgi:hypothetical protein